LDSHSKANRWLSFERVVRFGDSDAAGVIHFFHLFRWSHESWEQSLESFGLKNEDIFPGVNGNIANPEIVLPIVYSSANFFKPIKTGDILEVQIIPEEIDSKSFQVLIEFRREDDLVASTLIRHVAINSKTQKRCLIPKGIKSWLAAS
tara:strand:+ start:221 stop:664 length:444 start_codon:yes stop_codon:yes gene_type:complete